MCHGSNICKSVTVIVLWFRGSPAAETAKRSTPLLSVVRFNRYVGGSTLSIHPSVLAEALISCCFRHCHTTQINRSKKADIQSTKRPFLAKAINIELPCKGSHFPSMYTDFCREKVRYFHPLRHRPSGTIYLATQGSAKVIRGSESKRAGRESLTLASPSSKPCKTIPQ